MMKYVFEMEEIKSCEECQLLGLNGNEEIICQLTEVVFAHNGDTSNDFDTKSIHESCPLGQHIDDTLETNEMDVDTLVDSICTMFGVSPQVMSVRVEKVKKLLREVL